MCTAASRARGKAGSSGVLKASMLRNQTNPGYCVEQGVGFEKSRGLGCDFWCERLLSSSLFVLGCCLYIVSRGGENGGYQGSLYGIYISFIGGQGGFHILVNRFEAPVGSYTQQSVDKKKNGLFGRKL